MSRKGIYHKLLVTWPGCGIWSPSGAVQGIRVCYKVAAAPLWLGRVRTDWL